MEVEKIILAKVNTSNWGKALNHIQGVAKEVLTEEEFAEYVRKSNKDVRACAKMDGQLFNGQYFDWKEFDFKQKEIISAFLRYFDQSQLQKIANALQKGEVVLKSQRASWFATFIKNVKNKKDYFKVKRFLTSQRWENKNQYLRMLDETFPMYAK